MRRLTPLLLVVVAALAVGACGQSEEEKRAEAQAAYVDAVNDVQDRHLAKIANLATPNPTAKVVNQQADELHALAGDLRQVKAPDGVKAQHSQLATAVTLAEQDVRAGDALEVAIGRVRGAVEAINGKV
jgi:hypothetical protein